MLLKLKSRNNKNYVDFIDVINNEIYNKEEKI